MKIACVTPWGKNVRCGIRSYSEDLVAALAQLGVESYIVRLPRYGNPSPEIIRNVAESVPVDKIDLVLVEHEYGLYRNLERHLYDVLHMFGKPVVTTMHATGAIAGTDRYISKISDRIIVHNRHCAQLLRREGYSRSVIIPHGCSVKQCTPIAEARAKYGIPQNAKIVGYVGYLSEYKGIEALIGACSLTRGIFLLVGGGMQTTEPDSQYLSNLRMIAATKMPGRHDFTGFIPDEELSHIYGSMDVAAYPSTYVSESGGLLMALGYGKAVIARRLSPTKEKEAVGALTTFRNVKDLASKLETLMGDEEARKRLENGARRYCEENSWKTVAQKHVALFEEVLKGGGTRQR